MKRKNLVLGVLVGLALIEFSSIGFAKDLSNQPAPVSDTTQQAFPGFSDKLNSLLMDQLAALGYDSAAMAEEAKAIDSIKDATEQAKATDWFYNKYRSMAIQGLYRMAALAKSPEAEDLVINVEKALQASSPTPHGNLPQSISLIYQQINGSTASVVLGAAASPCITPMVRIGCFLAIFGNEECAYVDLPSVPSAQIFPTGVSAATDNFGHWLGDGHLNFINQGNFYWNTDHDLSAPRAGFHWPLKATDHTLCVEAKISHAIYVTNASTGLGFGSASAAWSMTLDGYGISRAGQPASNCSFVHAVNTDTTTYSIYSSGSDDTPRACWFRDLEEVYSRTVTMRPFLPASGIGIAAGGDPDIWNAASVDITSNLSTGSRQLGFTSTTSQAQIDLHGFGVLVVRDYQ